MLHITLQLRYTAQPQRAAAAWFLAGDDASAWLDELAQWELPLAPLKLYVVPRSRLDRGPCGLFVVGPAGSAPKQVSRAEPYGRIGRRLYLPLSAKLEPFATEAEIDALVVGDVAVFHPAAGLVAFEAADERRVWDLLAPPPRRAVAWDAARPGVASPPKLLAVAPLTPPTVEEAWQTWQDDIGSIAPEELPPAPGEPARWSLAAFRERIRSAVGRRRRRRQAVAGLPTPAGARRLRRGLRTLLVWLVGIAGAVAMFFFARELNRPSKGPPTGPIHQPQTTQPTPLADTPRPTTPATPQSPPGANPSPGLPGLFPGLLAALALLLGLVALSRRGATAGAGAIGNAPLRPSGVDAARQREINRLLHLLESNPDEGLRFALPLAGAGHRGLAPPGNQLTTRDVNFNLQRIGAGGGRADPWIVPWDVHQQLCERYRKLAEREQRLGRHRRAAYILAELLGDLSAAADVLGEGGHYREAAVLYRDRLNRPLDAAASFERCAAWDEAVEIYIAQQQFETAGDVLVRIERHDEAASMYGRQVAKFAAADDRRAAAVVLERKLQSPDEAAAMLASAWPNSSHARPCLKELFALLGRLGRHDEAAAWVDRLRRTPTPPSALTLALCDVLSHVSGAYPERRLGRAAADATRVLAGKHLEFAGTAETQELVGFVRALAPQDELLGRDAARFLSRSAPSAVSSVEPARKRGARGKRGSAAVEHLQRLNLPAEVSWQAAVGMGEVFYAAGFHRRGVMLVRGRWDGTIERIDWSIPSAERFRLLLEPALTSSVPFGLVLAGGPPLAIEQFPATVGWPWPIRCGTPGCATPDVQAIAYSEHGVAWTIDHELLLRARHADGGPLATHYLTLSETATHDLPIDPAQEWPPLIVARRNQVFVAVRRALFTLAQGRTVALDLTDDARRLVASAHHPSVRVAVGFAGGGALVVWNDPLRGPITTRVGDGITRPEIVFLLNGLLVVHDERQGRIYAPADWTYIERARFDGPFRSLVALLRGPQPHEFALLTADGVLRVCRVVE